MKIQAIFCVVFVLFCETGKSELQPIQEIFEPARNYDAKTHAKVAVLQWNPDEDTPLGVSAEEAERFKQANRNTIADYVAVAASRGARLVVTPEFSIIGYPDIPELSDEEDNFQSRADVEPYVEPIPGPSTDFFSIVAQRNNVYIHIGLAEVDPATKNYHNTVVVISPTGKIVAKHRKVHLFDSEAEFLVAGTTPTSYQSPFGTIGLAICSDIYADLPMDVYASKRIAALAVSASWTKWNDAMQHFQDAAKFLKASILAANQAYFPDAGVVEDTGEIQSHIRQSSGLAYGYLPLKKR